MSQYAYPYDPTAANPANVVINENYKLVDYPNKWKCIIPRFAPFYRLGLKLRDVASGRELYEGVDYYLGHYFKEASEGNRIATYGSIMLLTSPPSAVIKFEQYRTVGGRHNIIQSEIHTYLAKVNLPDPRNVDWAEVPTFRKPLAPVSPPDDILEAIAIDGPTGEIKKIADKLIELGAAEKDGFDALVARLTALDARVVNEEVENHHLQTDPHLITAAEVGAVTKNGAAADTAKVYGKTLAELTAYIKSLSITPYHVESLIKLVGDEFFGRLALQSGHLILTNVNGGSIVDMTNGDWTFYASDELTVSADSDNNETGAAAAISAKLNKLTVHSGGAGTSAKGAVYNGHYLVRAGNVTDYLTEPARAVFLLRTQNTATVDMSGEGSPEFPLRLDLKIPMATLGAEGIFELSHSLNRNSTAVAASAFAVDRLRKVFDLLVPKTRKVNGLSLDSNIILSPEHFGLERVNNTAAIDKEPSTAFIAAANAISNAAHTHLWSDVTNVSVATTANLGVTRLHDKIENIHDRGIQPAAVNPLAAAIVGINDDSKGKLPAYPLDVTQYGGFSYLPAPVLGGYGAAGIGEFVGGAGAVEADGNVVFLRNGGDVYETGVYYWYTTYDSAGALLDVVPTTTEYKPGYLAAGERVRYIGPNGDGVFLAYTTAGRLMLTLTRNTMDAKRHVATELLGGVVPMVKHLQLVIYKGYVYFIRKEFTTNYAVSAWRVALSDIEAGNAVTPEVVLLRGTNAAGQNLTGQTTFYYTTTHLSSDPSTYPTMLIEGTSPWHGINVRHAGQNSHGVKKDNLFRIHTFAGIYAWNAYGNGGGSHSTSVLINLDTFEVTVENRHEYPILAKANGTFVVPGGRSVAAPWEGAQPNAATVGITIGNRLFNFNTYGTLYLPRVIEFENVAGKSAFEHMRYDTTGYRSKWARSFIGLYGSSASASPNNVGFLDDNKLLVNQSAGNALVAKYDVNGSYLDDGSGWGPTTDRVTVSQATANAYRLVPRHWDKGKNVGAVFLGPTNEVFSGITDGALHTPLSYSASVEAALKAALIARMPGMHIPDTFVDERVSLTMFGAHNDADRTAFVTWDVMVYADASRTVKHAKRSLVKCTINFSGQAISSVVLGAVLIDSIVWNGSAIGFSSVVTLNQPTMATNHLGEKIYTIPTSVYLSYVGNGGTYGTLYIEKADGTVGVVYNQYIHAYTVGGVVYHPDFGIGILAVHGTGEGLMCSSYGNTLASWSASAPVQSLIHATRVASGWIIYFTEVARYYHGRVSYTLPVQNIDISNYAGLGEYRNKTLYIYVNMWTGTPRYVITNTKIPDTAIDFYIGYLVTDQFRILDIQVERATRIGRTLELERHMNDTDVHEMLMNLSLDNTSYSNLQNWTLSSTIPYVPTAESPDAYASIDMLLQLQSRMRDDFHITTGMCTDGNRIPLPRDFSYADCKVLVSYRGVHADAITSLDVRVVDSLFTVNAKRNGASAAVNYLLIASRKNI